MGIDDSNEVSVHTAKKLKRADQRKKAEAKAAKEWSQTDTEGKEDCKFF